MCFLLAVVLSHRRFCASSLRWPTWPTLVRHSRNHHDLESLSNGLVAAAIASVLGVAGAGFRLSLILNAISCEIVNAGFEVHGISKGVTLFSTMLKQTGTVLQTADSVHSTEAIETAMSIADESTRVFDEINDMLDRLGTKSSDGSATPSIQQRFRWCFKKNRVTYLMAQLESLKLSLAVMLQVIQLGQLMASTSRRCVAPVTNKCRYSNIQSCCIEILLKKSR